MKKSLSINIMLICLLTITVFSCRKNTIVKNPTSQPTVVSNRPTDPHFVSFAVANLAAKHINKSHLVSAIIHKKAINSLDSLLTKEVLDTLAIPDNINPSYYIFDYVGGGYAIISADNRVEPVLAFDDTGYFPKSGNISNGLVNWLTVNNKNMQLVRSNPTLSAPSAVTALWTELTTVDSAAGKVVNVAQPPPPTCQPTYSSYTVGPLLKTQWGQGWPYNELCPVGSYNQGHWATGCVATAMAQVMYYWKYPASYNYSIMPLDYYYNGNYELARLMVNIGTSVEMDYTATESNPDYDVLGS